MKYQFLLIVFLSTVNFSVFAQKEEVRKKVNFNADWKFTLSDSLEYSEVGFDDANWEKINLPHDWSIETKLSKENSGRNAWFSCGIGWYRKEFTITKEQKGEHVELQFDAIYRNSKIWINGTYVGAQYNGFTSFYFDISEYLNYDKPNRVAVRVDNSIQPSARWYTGSGIYRNTWLTITHPTHVKNWGTKITTPSVSLKEALISIETTIENYKNKEEVEVQTTLYDANNTKVGIAKTKIKTTLNKSYTALQNIKIINPKLWTIDSPNMYTAKSEVLINGKVVDDYISSFGVRSIRFDAKKGFFLNDKNIKMKGVCLHVDAGSLGVSVPIQVWERRLKHLKSIGCNAIRTAHNVAAPEFMDLCDQMGFLVMDEFADKWNDDGFVRKKNKKGNFFNPSGFANPYFELEWQKNYEQSVRRDVNHPSVVIWSVGNENHAPESIEQKVGLKKYTSFVRSIDDTRPVISGMERGRDGVPAQKVKQIIETCEYMDLIALNYGEQWCTAIGNQHPGKPFVSTESYTYFNSTPEKRFANIEKSPWLDVLENDHNMGLFLWVGADYLGESKKWPKLGSDSGLLDFAGFKSNKADFYQSQWTEEPMIKTYVYNGDADDFSTSGRWGWPPMHSSWNLEKGKQYDLVTYTNCEVVELYLNGKKIGAQNRVDFPNKIMKWKNITHQPGELKAVGFINGKQVCDFMLVTTGNTYKLKLLPQSSKVKSGDVVHVEVNMLDKKKNLVNDSKAIVDFTVEGNAKILAIENGDVNDVAYFGNKKSMVLNNGKCLVILKILNTDKEIVLKTTSKKNKGDMLVFKTK
ncbi:beta-galactosidase [Wenyingzhuangia heitensis]|uniref:Beta-galactosidase n=1 Tax=Wenyingzhuangia heitensis TaxID=1487859 RepID=A0ABX0U7J7_9FLAO|nr:glycoside hydrolase family 2 TIM barrel-domain containing protein [Wenyingzhuangia heitensis]NIJ44820.1 beta-galactosidase [Wenyingzhuangia heitensis]